MTKEKIINYAMSTPHNTNKAVLSAIIDQHDKETLDNAGFVKTVNGQGPDEQGNVEIEASGGVTSWNDLTDKPFEMVSITHAMDENSPALFICSHTYEQVKSMYDSGKNIAAFINDFNRSLDEENIIRSICIASEIYFRPGDDDDLDAIVFEFTSDNYNSRIRLTTEGCYAVVE